MTESHLPSVLLAMTGLETDGGIAAVNRCVQSAIDESVGAGTVGRCDRVLLFEAPDSLRTPLQSGEERLAGGSQARFVWELWRMLRRRPYDMIFVDHVGVAQSLNLPLPGLRRCPYVLFVHGLELAAAVSGRRAAALTNARTLLANSSFTGERLKRDYPVDPHRVRVVTLCIDPDRVASWEVLEQGEPRSIPREPAALIVGRMAAEQRGKGHDHLIEAWPRVRNAQPNAELWIAGGGDDRLRLEARAQELGVADAVKFLGRVDDEELHRLYRRASVFAMPSRQEGFGLVYAEAMWHGLPCVGSTRDAAVSVIRDGETGHLVPYGDVDAIATCLGGLLGDPARLTRMGEAGRQFAREHYGFARFRRDLLDAMGLAP